MAGLSGISNLYAVNDGIFHRGGGGQKFWMSLKNPISNG